MEPVASCPAMVCLQGGLIGVAPLWRAGLATRILTPRFPGRYQGRPDPCPQKQWLKDELLAATEPCIVLEIGSWWGDTTGFADGWDSFSTERQVFAEFFEDNDLTSRLFLLGADNTSWPATTGHTRSSTLVP